MGPRQPPVLAKKGSGAFNAEWERTLNTLDLPRLCVVLEGALDRRRLEELLRKALKGKAVRPGALDRAHLVAAVAELMHARAEVAFGAMRALDKSCSKERHIVASMEEDGIEVRLKSYRAIDFRRERARLIWALLRDGRQQPAQVAGTILDEHFDLVAEGVAERERSATTVATQKKHPRVGEEPEEQSFVRSLRKRVATYAEAIEEQAEVLHREKTERDKLEEERSTWLVKLGQRERALQAETKRRQLAEEQSQALRAEVANLSAQVQAQAPDRLRATEEERDRLRERSRSLERKVERAAQAADMHDENAALRAEVNELRADHERREAEHEHLYRELASREKAASRRSDDLRAALKTARQLAAGPTQQDPSLLDGEPVIERVGVFVDAANVSASARRLGQVKFDFVALLEALVGERRQTAAVAFVVDGTASGEAGGGASSFSRALKSAGYDVRNKKPKLRADGSRKADWDMGIAMEILDWRSRLDTIVLVSGDGDFIPLLRKLKSWGKRVEVASHLVSTDVQLLRVCHYHHDLAGRFSID